jgi:short-subunit dehydrogenase
MRVLITGAGGGMGRLLAQRFAADGATVFATARRLEMAEQVVDTLRRQGGKAHAYVLDVSDTQSIPRLRAQLCAEHGPIDVLVNNAGIVKGGAFDDVSLADHLATLQVNFLGAMAMIHAFLPDLIARPRAHLVNISSAAGFVSLPYGTSYAASKWALNGFSDSLRLELRQRGIRQLKVTTVCPSYVDTGMFAGVRPPFGLPMLKPEPLADAIMVAVRRGQPQLRAPFLLKLVDLGKGIMPLSLWDLYARLTGISSSMISFRGKTPLLADGSTSER